MGMTFTKNVNIEKKNNKNKNNSLFPHNRPLLQVPQTLNYANKTVAARLADKTIVFIKEIQIRKTAIRFRTASRCYVPLFRRKMEVCKALPK